MKIREVMSPNPVCCLPTDSAQWVARIMCEHNIGSLPVVMDQESRKLVGVITDRDLCCSVVADGLDPKTTTIEKFMTLNPVTCREEEDVENCERLMQEHQIRRIYTNNAAVRRLENYTFLTPVIHGKLTNVLPDLKREIFLRFSNIPANWPTWCVAPLARSRLYSRRMPRGTPTYLHGTAANQWQVAWHRFCVAPIHQPPTEPSLGKRQCNPCSPLLLP